MKNRHFAGFLILHIIAGAALYAGWRVGILQSFYGSDTYYLAVVLTGYAVWGLLCVLCGWWDRVEEVIEDLPTYGLLGTVVGFSVALGGIMSGETGARDAGLQVALNTTIVGLIGSQWLQECRRRLRPAKKKGCCRE